MNKLKLACVAISMAASVPVIAGGLLTNTNQNIAFNRMMSREASIGIDGVYTNPAGVAFMSDGAHLSLNLQTALQTRTIKNEYKLFANNTENPTTSRTFKGDAVAPVVPSIQFAYNWNNFSFQTNFSVGGGGGKCTFDDGLGSFEKIVAETAVAACGLAGVVDNALGAQMFTSDQALGTNGQYSYKSYMQGRQYYYGISLGTAYKFSDKFSAFAGIRGVYASCNYYGYVKDIKVGNTEMYKLLDPTKTNSADIELNCDQTGIGFTPILGIDFKTGKWNFAAKYEFKTRMRLKNKSVNMAPSIGGLAGNLSSQIVAAYVNAGLTQEQAIAATTAKLQNPAITGTMNALKNQFDTKIGESVGEFEDGKKVAADIPALLAIGVGYNPIDPLKINVGFHYFWDKQATSYGHKEDKLDRGTVELNAGVEYDASKLVTVSAGWQNTSYGISDEYMEDKSFSVSSNSIGAGVCLHVTKKIDVNLAYFCTLYSHKKTSENVALTESISNPYTSDYTRTNNVFGVGVDFNF